LVREIKRFNSEKEVVRGRKKVVIVREKRRREKEKRLAKGGRRGRIVPGL